jgi:hypothetical protein
MTPPSAKEEKALALGETRASIIPDIKVLTFLSWLVILDT